MAKLTMKQVDLWQIMAGAQYLFLGVLMLCSFLNIPNGHGIGYGLMILGVALPPIVLAGLICSIVEKSRTGFLVVGAPAGLCLLWEVLTMFSGDKW